MPQVFRMGSYLVYFWSDECNPLEPVHVHVSAGEPTRDATKIWLTKAGGGCNEIFMQSQRGLAAENAKDARLMPRSRPASGL